MIKVLLAEDMHMIRAALGALLGPERDIEAVTEVTRGDEILPAALLTRPDVAVLDIDLPGMDGVTASVELRARLPGCRVLILTAMGRPAGCAGPWRRASRRSSSRTPPVTVWPTRSGAPHGGCGSWIPSWSSRPPSPARAR